VLKRIKELIESASTHAGLRRYAANTSWMFAEQLMRMIAGVLVGVWVARYLGPTQFGQFNYVVAFAALFSSISKLGLDSVIVRDLVREPGRRDVYMGTAFWLKLIAAIITLIIVAIATQFTSSDITTKIYIFIISSGAIFQSFEVVDFYFQSKVLSKFVSICRLIQLASSSLLKLYLIYLDASLFSFVVVSLLDQVTLAASLYVAYLFQKVDRFWSCFNWGVARGLMKDGWPMILSGVAITIYMRIDQIMIQELLGSEQVGIYSAAVRLCEVWYVIPTILTTSLFPAIVAAKKSNESVYNQRIKNLYKLMIWVSIVFAIVVTCLADWGVVFLYGAKYQLASQILKVSIWNCVIVSVGSVWSKWILAENMQKLFTYQVLLSSILNIALNIYLIKDFGVMGAAYATLVTNIIGQQVFFSLYKYKETLQYIKSAMKFWEWTA